MQHGFIMYDGVKWCSSHWSTGVRHIKTLLTVS